MTTLFLEPDSSYEEKIVEAMNTFSELNETSAANLVLWLKERPSMSNMIDHDELMQLKFIVWQ